MQYQKNNKDQKDKRHRKARSPEYIIDSDLGEMNYAEPYGNQYISPMIMKGEQSIDANEHIPGVTQPSLQGTIVQIKNELKDAGFYFSANLKWHKATKDEKYADRLIEVKLGDIAEWSAWGKASFNRDAQKIVEEKIAAVQPKPTSEWIGEVGSKLKDIKVQLTRKYSFDGRYGVTTVYNFVTEEGNQLTWFSSTYQPYEVNTWVKMKYATIKDHSEYKGVKSTIITRAKLADLAPAQE
jgi:hypothetical protein